MKQNRVILTKEQKEYMLSILADYSSKEVVKIMKEKYNVELVEYKIKHYRQWYGIKCNVHTGRFKKGELVGAKNFKYHPVGYEYIDSEGFVHIKVAEPNVWEEKQRYVYKQHYGEIPKGYNVIFLDKDRTNCDINNLKLIKNKDLLVAKNMGLLFDNKELTEVGLTIAQLINKKCETKGERL